jgi:hypothetical protein
MPDFEPPSSLRDNPIAQPLEVDEPTLLVIGVASQSHQLDFELHLPHWTVAGTTPTVFRQSSQFRRLAVPPFGMPNLVGITGDRYS